MYHYWVNHASYRYAHEHFPFVYTNTIERTWLVMKKQNPGLAHNSKPIHIERYGDCFSMRQILKPECIYEFTLKSMRDYYFDMI
jgi:hypothetical protein